MAKKFTTKDLSKKLLEALNSSSVAHGNMVARVGAVMIASKQLELNERAQGGTTGVTLVDAENDPPLLTQVA